LNPILQRSEIFDGGFDTCVLSPRGFSESIEEIGIQQIAV
jgi:hypothetical protein